MAVNKNALIRYKTIDKCLRNRFRRWTLDDLIEACSDALYDYEGKDTNVSKRTIQLDIQNMRSDKLGYNAPIIVVDRKYYTYEEEEYSIMNLPISDQDLSKLNEAVHFLSQFKGFSHFNELNSMVQKLQDQIYAQTTNKTPIIDFEKNENLKGLEFLDVLYQSILNKETILLTYKSFKARQEDTFVFYPFMLKEFNNRWFVIGQRKKREGIMNLALDRILAVDKSDVPFVMNKDFDAEKHFKHAIGVSVMPNNEGTYMEFYVTQKHAPYVETKPLHWTQKTIARDYYGIVISLQVQHNYELEKQILGLGDGIRVIKPERLKRIIQERLHAAIDLYKSDLNESSLKTVSKKIENRGFGILNYIFTQREIKRMHKYIHRYFKEKDRNYENVDGVLEHMGVLKTFINNQKLERVLRQVGLSGEFVDSRFVTVKKRNVEPSEWMYLDTEQTYKLIVFLHDVDDKQSSIQMIKGSHSKPHTKEEVNIIAENALPNAPSVFAGGILIMHPRMIYRLSPKYNQKRISWFEFDLLPDQHNPKKEEKQQEVLKKQQIKS